MAGNINDSRKESFQEVGGKMGQNASITRGDTWAPPVSNAGALPPSGNNLGDIRQTLYNGTLYRWNGSAWSAYGSVGIIWLGVYSGATAYLINDAVSFNGSSYICIAPTTGNDPTNATYWNLIAQKGADGMGSGDMLASVYDPTGIATNVYARANHTGTQLASTISDFQTAVNTNRFVRNAMTTHLPQRVTMTVNANPAKFDIPAFTAIFVDNYTNPTSPTVTTLNYAGSTANTVTNLATWDVTYISVDSAGVVYQTQTNPNEGNLRDRVTLGSLVHTGHTQIDAISEFVNTNGWDMAAALADISDAIGPISVGNKFSANGANLKINKSAGRSIQVGLNVKNSFKSPNVTTDSALTATTFIYSWRNGSGGFNSTITSDIVPGKYDDGTGGASTPNGTVNTNKWSLQKIYYASDANLVAIEYGQAFYNTMAEAEAAKSDDTVSNPALAGSQFRGWLIVRGGATNLSLAADAKFLDAGKYGLTTSGAGTGSSTTTMQQSYDNSTQPQITTSLSLGSVDYQNGSGVDSNYTQRWKNNAGSVVAGIRGDGVPTATTDLVTKSYADALVTTGTIGSLINGATENTTLVDADMFGIMDSAASNILKKFSWANMKTNIKSYYDSVSSTLTNKSIGLGSNTLTGTIAQFNTACTDSDFVDTLSGQTITGQKHFSNNDTNFGDNTKCWADIGNLGSTTEVYMDARGVGADVNLCLRPKGTGFFSITTIEGLQRLRITSSGNIGIGNTWPVSRLQIAGNVHISDGNHLLVGDSITRVSDTDSATLSINYFSGRTDGSLANTQFRNTGVYNGKYGEIASFIGSTGKFKYVGDGTFGSGKVLTSDASGNATWSTPTASFNGVLCTGTYMVTASITAVTFTTESYDTDAFHDNATNTSRLTVPSVALAGKYRMTGNIQIQAGSNLGMIARIRKNGTETVCEERFLGGASGCSCSITCDDLTANGDYYELMVLYGSAQSANVRFGWHRMG